MLYYVLIWQYHDLFFDTSSDLDMLLIRLNSLINEFKCDPDFKYLLLGNCQVINSNYFKE